MSANKKTRVYKNLVVTLKTIAFMFQWFLEKIADLFRWGFRNPELACVYLLFFTEMFWLSLVFQPSPVPNVEILKSTKQLTGKAVSVEFQHSFFGMGATDATIVTFSNNSDLVSFKFNADLDVESGKTYTVMYEQKETLYYNTTTVYPTMIAFLYLPYTNKTEIQPIKIIEA